MTTLDSLDAKTEERLFAAFAKWDIDGNGHISKFELKRILKLIGHAESDCDAVFQAIDANHDGEVSYREWIRWMFKQEDQFKDILNPLMASNSAEKAMETILSELQKLRGQGRKMRDIFDELDLNHNNTVSLHEFITGLRNLKIKGFTINEHEYSDQVLLGVFKLIDTAKVDSKNHGVITFKEFKQALQKLEKHS